MALLARSGGRRETDIFEVFEQPEPDSDDRYRAVFFVHGLRHRGGEAPRRALLLERGERLTLGPEPDNVADAHALRVVSGDGVHLGFVPRYLCSDFNVLRSQRAPDALLRVQRLNPPPAPLQFRILCAFDSRWPVGFAPCSEPDFQPLPAPVESLVAASVAPAAGDAAFPH